MDRRAGLGSGVVVQRHGEGGAEGEGVVPGDSVGAERVEGRRALAVDPQLDELAAEVVSERGRSVESDEATRVHDRDPVAQLLGLVEVVRREQDGQLRTRAQLRDDVEELGADARIEPDRRLVEEQHPRL